MAGGGSVGVLLGGLIVNIADWRWIFLVNLPIGLGVIAMALRLLPRGGAALARPRLDWAGAVTVTAALMLAVYGSWRPSRPAGPRPRRSGPSRRRWCCSPSSC
jgi:MFS family permease